MVDLSKVCPVQSIARSNCGPRILSEVQAASMRLGALADWPWLLWWLLSFVKLSTTQLQSYQKETLGELLLEPKTCIKEYGFWIYTNNVQCYLMQGTHTQEMSLPNPVALQSSRLFTVRLLSFPVGVLSSG